MVEGLRKALGAACLALLGGCVSGAGGDGGEQASAGEKSCARLLRELRLYCQEGIVEDERASFRMSCMSRRLAFDRQCIPRNGG
jgi:hypothetical protein